MDKSPTYSVLIPVHNSQSSLQNLIERLTEEMKKHGSFEIICVDDGSKDKSWKVLKELKQDAKYEQHLKIFRLSKNYGQSAASICAIDQSKGEHIITIDDDLQYEPESIPLLLKVYQEEQKVMVFGVGKQLKHGKLYRLLLWLLGGFFRLWPLNYLNGDNLASSFRIFRRSCLEIPNVFGGKLNSMHVANYNLDPMHIGHVKVPHHPGKRPTSSYKWPKRLEHFIDLMVNLNTRPFIKLIPIFFALMPLWTVSLLGCIESWHILFTYLLIVSSSILVFLLAFGLIVSLLYQGKILAILNGSPPYLVIESHE